MGYQIIALSPDHPGRLSSAIEKQKLEYLLLSDTEMVTARAFGVAYKVDDQTFERYKSHGLDLERACGEKHHLLPVPSVFIIGTDGIIQFEYVNPNYTVRIKSDLLMAAAMVSQE